MKRSVYFVTASVLPCLVACGVDDDYAPRPLPESGVRAAIVSGEFDALNGVLSAVAVERLAVVDNLSPVGGVGSDPVMRRDGDKLYVINRFGPDNVSVYDARTMRFEEQYACGMNSNPQDVAVVGDTMWVAVLGEGGLVAIDRASGDATTIDLSAALGDPDGSPNCVSVYAVGTTVFVACGLLDDSFTPRGAGKVAVVDTTTRSISTITLPAPNPLNFFVRTPESSVFGGDLLIATTPSYTDYGRGCVARISTGDAPAARCADGLANASVAGFETHMDVSADGSMLWMSVGTYDADFNATGSLRGFDLTTGTLQSPLTSAQHLIVDVAACPDGGVIAVDRAFNAAGVRVFGADLVQRTTGPLPIGLPPSFGNNTVCYDPDAL